mgnify:CR=1 FL=1
MVKDKIDEGLSRRELIKLGLYGFLGTLIGGIVIPSSGTSESRAFSQKYGEVVYQRDLHLPNHLYIVGQRHRIDHLKDAFGEELFKTLKRESTVIKKTPLAQVEIYRIIEFLIKNKDLGLILQEGAFSEDDYSSLLRELKESFGEERIRKLKKIDDKNLEKVLGFEDFPFTGSQLVSLSYNIGIQGPESKQTYEFIIEITKKFIGRDATLIRRINDYMNELRSAAVLANSPVVIEREHKLGRIKNRKAAIVIGNHHLDELIRFIDGDRIFIEGAPEANLDKVEGKLNLREKGYGVTVIRPKSLLEK